LSRVKRGCGAGSEYVRELIGQHQDQLRQGIDVWRVLRGAGDVPAWMQGTDST